jgi:hypothetical protein
MISRPNLEEFKFFGKNNSNYTLFIPLYERLNLDLFELGNVRIKCEFSRAQIGSWIHRKGTQVEKLSHSDEQNAFLTSGFSNVANYAFSARRTKKNSGVFCRCQRSKDIDGTTDDGRTGDKVKYEAVFSKNALQIYSIIWSYFSSFFLS